MMKVRNVKLFTPLKISTRNCSISRKVTRRHDGIVGTSQILECSDRLGCSIAYLLFVAVGEDPVLLLRMEKQAEDIEVEAVFLIGGALIRADQQTVLHLRVGQQHDLEHRLEFSDVRRDLPILCEVNLMLK